MRAKFNKVERLVGVISLHFHSALYPSLRLCQYSFQLDRSDIRTSPSGTFHLYNLNINCEWKVPYTTQLQAIPSLSEYFKETVIEIEPLNLPPFSSDLVKFKASALSTAFGDSLALYIDSPLRDISVKLTLKDFSVHLSEQSKT